MEMFLSIYFLLSSLYLLIGIFEGFMFIDDCFLSDLSINLGRIIVPIFWVGAIVGIALGLIKKILNIRIF